MGEASEGLRRVWAAEGPEALGRAYAAWGDGYDRDMARLGYCLPFAVAAWAARHVPTGSGRILDVGCGTGLAGPLLAALGYEVEGMDMSGDMLARAQARGAYARLTRATLGEPLPFATGAFAAAVSAGVFTDGHAPASSLPEVARAVRPGGHLILTVRETVFDAGGFGDVIDRLRGDGRWSLVEQSGPFRSFALGEPEAIVRAHVLRVGSPA